MLIMINFLWRGFGFVHNLGTLEFLTDDVNHISSTNQVRDWKPFSFPIKKAINKL